MSAIAIPAAAIEAAAEAMHADECGYAWADANEPCRDNYRGKARAAYPSIRAAVLAELVELALDDVGRAWKRHQDALDTRKYVPGSRKSREAIESHDRALAVLNWIQSFDDHGSEARNDGE